MITLIATAAAAIAAVAAGAWWTWRKVQRMLDFEYQAGYRLGRHDQYMWHEHCRTAIAATEPPAIEGPSDPIDPDGWEDQGDDAAEATAYFQALAADDPPADTAPDLDERLVHTWDHGPITEETALEWGARGRADIAGWTNEPWMTQMPWDLEEAQNR